MKRPRQHEIETLADTQLRSVLPPQWIVRDLRPDYGLDKDIEILTLGGQKVVNFRVQLKGTESLKPNSAGPDIKFNLLIKHARYFCKEVCAPVLIVLADIVSKKTYWYAPQIDHDLQSRLDKSSKKSIVVPIPTRNVLPETLSALLAAVDKCANFLSMRAISEAKPHKFADPFPGGEDLKRVIAGCQEKTDLLRFKSLTELYDAGKYEDSFKEAKTILDNKASTIEARFHAAIHISRIRYKQQPNAMWAIHEYNSRVTWDTARVLLDLTKDGPDRLRCYADMVLCTARLNDLVRNDTYNYMNWRLNKDTGDPLWMMVLAQRRRDTTRRIDRTYRQIIRLMRYAFRIQAYEMLPSCVGQIPYFMAHFISRLWEEGFDKAAAVYRESLQSLLDIAVRIEHTLGSNVLLKALLHSAVFMMRPNDAEDRRKTDMWIRHHIDQIEDSEMKSQMESELEKCYAALEATMVAQEDNLEEEKQIYMGMAASLGVNLNNPNDDIAKVIRIGIADLNPERVLRHCQHMFFMLWSTGVIGEWLHLPTAGFKALCCMKRDVQITGFSLDATFQVFQADMKCEKCPDRQPHHETWKWTRKWQREQDEIFKKKYPGWKGFTH